MVQKNQAPIESRSISSTLKSFPALSVGLDVKIQDAKGNALDVKRQIVKLSTCLSNHEI